MSYCLRRVKLFAFGTPLDGSSLRYNRNPSIIRPPGRYGLPSMIVHACPATHPPSVPPPHGGLRRRKLVSGNEPAILFESSQTSNGPAPPSSLLLGDHLRTFFLYPSS